MTNFSITKRLEVLAATLATVALEIRQIARQLKNTTPPEQKSKRDTGHQSGITDLSQTGITPRRKKDAKGRA